MGDCPSSISTSNQLPACKLISPFQPVSSISLVRRFAPPPQFAQTSLQIHTIVVPRDLCSTNTLDQRPTKPKRALSVLCYLQRRHRLPTSTNANIVRQPGQHGQLEPVFWIPSYRIPSFEIATTNSISNDNGQWHLQVIS